MTLKAIDCFKLYIKIVEKMNSLSLEIGGWYFPFIWSIKLHHAKARNKTICKTEVILLIWSHNKEQQIKLRYTWLICKKQKQKKTMDHTIACKAKTPFLPLRCALASRTMHAISQNQQHCRILCCPEPRWNQDDEDVSWSACTRNPQLQNFLSPTN